MIDVMLQYINIQRAWTIKLSSLKFCQYYYILVYNFTWAQFESTFCATIFSKGKTAASNWS